MPAFTGRDLPDVAAVKSGAAMQQSPILEFH